MNEITNVPTLTATELMRRLRASGIRISYNAMVAAIDAGIFPFARRLQLEGSRKSKYIIYESGFDAWVRQHAGEDQT